ncbi:DNA polymerase III subunit delta [Salinisphaera sp. USBA-960]|uniref:DNA polymerase III subunit delta n=1 Tax=Salinisphaera orenii TaxID=856731 RepID=UPI000DBE343A|nr:DNA polymerase III subunit delta [Salifodinibacter halophilus]NNC25564.1 DNA polymerase III subunit delta [Salifodinibacter halophilus]
MEIAPDRLADKLDGSQLASIYLIGGSEPLQVVEAADAVRAAARRHGFDEREIHHAEPGFDWDRIRSAGATGSLFANKQCIELHIPSQGPGKTGAAALKEIANKPPADTIILIVAPSLQGNARQSAWYKALSSAGIAVFAWPVSGNALRSWLNNRAHAAGVTLAEDAVALLAERTEGNLLAASQQIDRLALTTPGETIDATTIEAVAGDDAHFDMFALTARAVDGDRAGAIRVLRRLRTEGTDPVPITWALVREIRLLYRAAVAARYDQVDAVLSKVFMPAARKRRITELARRTSSDHLAHVLHDVARIDRINKGAEAGRAWDELVSLIHGLVDCTYGRKVAA